MRQFAHWVLLSSLRARCSASRRRPSSNRRPTCRSVCVTPERASQVASWFDLVRDFAAQSKFGDFFRAHQPFYRRTIGAFRRLVTSDHIAPLESYYGRKQAPYHFILGPLLPGNFGVRIPAGGGQFHVYDITSASQIQDGVPAYGMD